ncbi:MAG: UDP-N-acetylglucosamine 2-epimerase [Desulfosoma sp.]|uniref:UDP-N-acetylglucosamine 2-epimerase n=1 Tax=Desulfosoma sp. TaxID=2603217 RepID=UPI00404AC2A7
MVYITIGTKAQLIKMVCVMREGAHIGLNYNSILTGQHHETMEYIIKKFVLPEPNYVLSKGTDASTIKMAYQWCMKCLALGLTNSRSIFQNDRNGIVFVYVDTASTLLGGLLAKASGLKVGHVETALRSFNLLHPFPEELTCLATFQLCAYFFCPTERDAENINKYRGAKYVTGGNMLYYAVWFAVNAPMRLNCQVFSDEYGVVGIHRFQNIFNKKRLESIYDINTDVEYNFTLIFVLHRTTEHKLKQYGLYQRIENI